MQHQQKILLYIVFFILAKLLIVENLHAQLYENRFRPSLERYELVTPHFRIVFPKGEDRAAIRTALYLENEYDDIQSLVGGSLERFPVVLNSHNDLSNGFVTTGFFRSEIETPPIKSFSLNPGTGSWLYTVVPHELVHALHYSNIPRSGFANFISIFSGDLGKSVHGAAPFGVHEGLAVYYESKLNEGIGGRGNYGWFTNHTNTVMNSDRPWSPAQTLMTSMYTNPGDRHYKGGYAFKNWLAETYGEQTMRESIETFAQFPLFGYGWTLRKATGMSVSKLFKEYRESFTGKYEDVDLIKPLNAEMIETNTRGGNIFHPKWISGTEVLYYRSGSYNRPAGFYIYDLDDRKESLQLETLSIGNGNFILSESGESFTYSRYTTHPFQDNSFEMNGFIHSRKINNTSKIKYSSRLFNIFEKNDRYFGLSVFEDTNQLYEIIDDRKVNVLNIYPGTIEQVEPTWDEKIVLLMNIDGRQGVWFSSIDSLKVNIANPDIMVEGTNIISINWVNDQFLLMSVDDGNRVSNLVYTIDDETLHGLTFKKENTFFADLNPNTGKLVYITQLHDQQVLTFAEWSEDFLEEVAYKTSIRLPEQNLYAKPASWEINPYKTGFSWLIPRTVLPVANERDGFVNQGFGVSVSGGDLLQRHSYEANLVVYNVLQAELLYQNSTFYPGYQIDLFYRPLNTVVGLALERGARFSIPLRWRTAWNTRQSWISFNPGFRFRQFRFVDTPTTDQITLDYNWFTDPSLTASLAYYHRIRQHRRDIQPNSGTVLFKKGELYVGTDRTGEEPAGLRLGIIQYLPVLSVFNHSMMVRADVVTQRKTRVFSTGGLVYDGFSENPLLGLHNAGSLRLRYTFPLTYVDNGFISIPFFLDRLYMSLNVNNVFDLNTTTTENWVENSRTVYGSELRSDFRFFNLPINAGIGIGWEPTRDDYTFFFSIVF